MKFDKVDRIIREKECREITGLSRATRYRWEKQGKFPKRVQISSGVVGWLQSSIIEWLQELKPAFG